MYLLLLLLHKESDLLYFPAPVFLNRLHAHHTYRGNHRNMEDGGRERERERELSCTSVPLMHHSS